MLPAIAREASQLKTFFKTAGRLTVHTSSCKVKTVGQTSLLANNQLTMTLKLKVKPGWVSVLKSTTSFSIQRRPLRAPIYCELPHEYFCLSEIVTSCHHKNEHVKVTKGPLSVEELMSAEEFWIKKLKFTSMT